MKERIEQLEKELAELKAAEFKAGDWVIHGSTMSDYMVVWNDGDPVYGFMNGRWRDSLIFGLCRMDVMRKATQEEVKEALIREAKKRGFPCQEWAHHDCYFHNGGKWENWDYYPESDRLNLMGGPVYERGVWATPLEGKIEVNGYEAEFCEGYVKFGCAKIDNRFFTDLAERKPWEFKGNGMGNRFVTAVKIGEGIFDVETINKICERLK